MKTKFTFVAEQGIQKDLLRLQRQAPFKYFSKNYDRNRKNKTDQNLTKADVSNQTAVNLTSTETILLQTTTVNAINTTTICKKEMWNTFQTRKSEIIRHRQISPSKKWKVIVKRRKFSWRKSILVIEVRNICYSVVGRQASLAKEMYRWLRNCRWSIKEIKVWGRSLSWCRIVLREIVCGRKIKARRGTVALRNNIWFGIFRTNRHEIRQPRGSSNSFILCRHKLIEDINIRKHTA